MKFHGSAKTTKITATTVTVEYDSGEKIDLTADIVVMAVGVAPATEFLEGSGIERRKDGGVEVDGGMKVKGVEDIYAVGQLNVSIII